MKRAWSIVLLSLLLFALATLAASAQTVGEIVEKHLAALGGRDVVSALTTRRATGTVTVSAAVGDLAGTIEVDAKAPNLARSRLTLDLTALGAGQMTIERRFNGTDGFVSNSLQGDAAFSPTERDASRNSVFPSPFLNYADTGAIVTMLPRQTIAGVDMIGLRFTPKAGPSTELYFDAATYLIARAVTTVSESQGGGDVTQTSDVSDYRVVDGVKVPFRLVNTTPTQTVTITLTSVAHNVPLDDVLFSKR